VAHQAAFERIIWNVTLRSRPDYAGWPALTIEQMDDTMARALAIHLPADLDTLAIVLGLPENKDAEGGKLMRKMAQPRRRNEDGTFVWWDEPWMVQRLGAYCDQDVIVEALVDEKLPPLSSDERRLWILDQKINDRGVAIDVKTVRRCVAVLEVASERADARMRDLTDGGVERVTQALRIRAWLQGRGTPAESIAKGEHDELTAWADALGDETARKVVELRAEAGRSSTAKFQRMLDCICADGRARGLFAYHRASTGRFGGAMIQPQNLSRFLDVKIDHDYLPDVLRAIEIMEMAA
jgi:DNA polymerase